MTTAKDNGDGRQQQQQWQMMTAADDDGTPDWVADYEGEGGEQAANNKGTRARRAENMNK
jgi:hypothetical protein